MIDLGDTQRLEVEIRDDTGALVPGSGITFTVTLPDGSTATPAVTNPSTGVYRVDYVPTQLGSHKWKATSGNPITSTNDTFEVVAPTSALVSLAEAKAYLNKSSSVTFDDDELRAFRDAASDLVTQMTGITGAPKTAVVRRGAYGRAMLPDAPIVGVSSVRDKNGNLLATGAYTIDLGSGIITLPGWWQPPWYYPQDTITVVYTVTDGVPAPVRLAVMDLTADLWRSQRGVTAGTRFAPAPDAMTPGPQPRWRTLLAPYMSVPAVA